MPREVSRSLGPAARLGFTRGRPHPGAPVRQVVQPLRFLVCGDFRLDETCQPVRGLPADLESRLLSAPYSAAGQVLDVAVFEQVDFVVLIGTQFSADSCGVKEPAFLSQQFQRLSEVSIPVIWIRGADTVAGGWPTWFSWPPGVFEIDTSAAQTYAFDRADRLSAIVSTAVPSPLPVTESRLVRIGVIPHPSDSAPDLERWRDFDCLLSTSGPYTVVDRMDHSIPAEFAAGVGPQGRGFHEYGPHGCWLVTIDATHKTHVDFVPCDVIRWRREFAEINDDTTWGQLCEMCITQSQRAQSSGHALTFLKWQFFGHGPLCRELWEASRMQDLLQELRQSLESEVQHEGRVWIAETEIVFDPREEARLRSEQRAWAAWNSAIDEFESMARTPQATNTHSAGAVEERSHVEVLSSHSHLHFHQLRRKALRKLIHRVDDE